MQKNFHKLRQFQIELLNDYEVESELSNDKCGAKLTLSFYDIELQAKTRLSIETSTEKDGVAVNTIHQNYKYKNIEDALAFTRLKIQLLYLHFLFVKSKIIKDIRLFINSAEKYNLKAALDRFLLLAMKRITIEDCLMIINAGADERIATESGSNELRKYFSNKGLAEQLNEHLKVNLDAMPTKKIKV